MAFGELDWSVLHYVLHVGTTWLIRLNSPCRAAIPAVSQSLPSLLQHVRSVDTSVWLEMKPKRLQTGWRRTLPVRDCTSVGLLPATNPRTYRALKRALLMTLGPCSHRPSYLSWPHLSQPHLAHSACLLKKLYIMPMFFLFCLKTFNGRSMSN